MSPDLITADTLRWVNVVLAMLVVILMITGSMRRWGSLPARLRRVVPWVIATYVVIAYGSGEVAASGADVDPGIRVVLLILVLLGLVVALAWRISDDTYEP